MYMYLDKEKNVEK